MLTASQRRSPLRLSSLRSWLSRWGILDWFRLLWCAAVCWYEFASFLSSVSSCPWPDNALSPTRERPAHLLLVADPQIRDLSTSRAAGFAAIRQHFVDFTLKRNWFFASRKSPDIVVFLGDILASWRFIRSDDEYERNYNRFLDIFRLDRRIPSYFVPGNNDVGLNIDSAIARQARHRFTTHFGALNQKISIRNHTLVMLDAAGLVEEDYLRAAKYIDYDRWTPLPRGPVEFVHSLREADITNSTILFTHIPLHRPDTASCGPLRERGAIRRGVGPSYQNMLGKKTTTFLLQSITPQIVFSADDKDYCDYVHVPPRSISVDAVEGTRENKTDPVQPRNVREVTLKAFAPSSEIRYPGFQLLSLTYPSSSSNIPSLATTPCFLPDYPSVCTWRYLPLLVLTTLTLIALRRRKRRTRSLPTHLDTSALSKSFSLDSLPTAPWSAQPHPPTPYSPDWSPHTPGFYRSAHSAKTPPSPQVEFPRDSLRAPLSSSHSHPSLSNANAPATPTFRATAIPRTDSDGHAQHLPTGPAHIDVDELDGDGDEFAYGQYDQRQPLRVKLHRSGPGPASGDVSPTSSSDAGAVDELAFTFTLYGRRRRISFWIPLFTGRGRARSSSVSGAVGAVGFGGRGRRSTRAFVRRVGIDLGYVLWPAVLLWLVLAWLVS